MTLASVLQLLEGFAPLSWQEEYDNSGLQLGFFDAQGLPMDNQTPVSGILLCLDITEEVIDEAVQKGCNLIIAHHPLVFKPLRSLTGRSCPERCVAKALKNGIALYAIHTNLDNAPGGVSWEMARLLGLENVQTLVPTSEPQVGSGVIGDLPVAVPTVDFMRRLNEIFQPASLLYSKIEKSLVKRIALCGGSGGSFVADAVAAGADCYVTGEIRYHDFFESGNCVLVAMGHYESEICAVDLLQRLLVEAFPAAPIFKTTVNTNPLNGLASL